MPTCWLGETECATGARINGAWRCEPCQSVAPLVAQLRREARDPADAEPILMAFAVLAALIVASQRRCAARGHGC